MHVSPLLLLAVFFSQARDIILITQPKRVRISLPPEKKNVLAVVRHAETKLSVLLFWLNFTTSASFPMTGMEWDLLSDFACHHPLCFEPGFPQGGVPTVPVPSGAPSIPTVRPGSEPRGVSGANC